MKIYHFGNSIGAKQFVHYAWKFNIQSIIATAWLHAEETNHAWIKLRAVFASHSFLIDWYGYQDPTYPSSKFAPLSSYDFVVDFCPNTWLNWDFKHLVFNFINNFINEKDGNILEKLFNCLIIIKLMKN